MSVQTEEFRKMANAKALCLQELERSNWNPRTLKFILKPLNDVSKADFSKEVFRDIVFLSARICKCPISIILSRSRIREANYARQLCFYILCRDFKFTQQETGDNFSRDHSSVIHGRDRIQNFIDINDKQTIEYLKRIRELL
jgi:chromosomal replication initiation ATPase DnaA